MGFITGAVIGVAVGELVRILAPNWTKRARDIVKDFKESVTQGFRAAKDEQTQQGRQ